MPAVLRLVSIVLFLCFPFLVFAQSATQVIESCPLWQSGSYIGGSPIGVTQLSFTDVWKVYPSCQPATVSSCQPGPTGATTYVCVGTTGGNCSCSQTPCSPGASGVTLGGTSKIGYVYVGTPPNQKAYCGYNVQPTSPKPPKNNGNPRDKDPENCCGNPVNTGTGNKYQEEADFPAPYEGGLSFSRFYNSAEFGKRTTVGANWRHTWLRWIDQFTTTEAYAQRPDGVRRTFVAGPNGTWAGEVDTPDALVRTAGGWTLTTRDNETEYYDNAGRITELIDSAGRHFLFAYSNGTAASGTFEGTTTPLPVGLLTQVTDHRGRQLQFRYNTSSLLTKVIDSQGLIYAFTYDLANGNPVTVAYPDGRTKTYHYNEPAHNSGYSQPNALTGITDEKGIRYATFKYDTSGRGIRSEHAGGVFGFSFTYGTSGATSFVDPLGTSRTTAHTVVNGVAMRGSTTQNCPGCGGTATKSKTFDANGNVASIKDFNGNLTCFTHDLARNLETARTEGLSGSGTCSSRVTTAATRTITTEWHPQWRVRKRVAEPLRITTNAYHGEAGVSCAPAGASQTLLCSRTVQATTDANGASAFSAAADGAPRTWSFTYNADGQLLAADGPRTDVADVSTRTYYTANDPSGNYRVGDLATSTDAAGHTTQYTHYDAAGRLKRMVDPNGLETLLEYWPRGWLKSRSVGTSVAGFETTNYDYEHSGQLSRVTMPDGRFVNYGYDNAQRLVEMSDGLGNRIAYTLEGRETASPRTPMTRATSSRAPTPGNSTCWAGSTGTSAARTPPSR